MIPAAARTRSSVSINRRLSACVITGLSVSPLRRHSPTWRASYWYPVPGSFGTGMICRLSGRSGIEFNGGGRFIKTGGKPDPAFAAVDIGFCGEVGCITGKQLGQCAIFVFEQYGALFVDPGGGGRHGRLDFIRSSQNGKGNKYIVNPDVQHRSSAQCGIK